MIKVTLPNGIVVEGDSAQEVGVMIDVLHADPAPEPAPVIKAPGPAPVIKMVNATFPHRIGDGKGTVKIGARQEQVLSAAKLLAEAGGSRNYEISSKDIADLVGVEATLVRSALNVLLRAGIVRHGSKRTAWIVTHKGWAARFRVTAPIRAGKTG